MIKAIGQTGLNFIANKFKELKALVDKKADKTEIKTKLSELTGDSTHRTVTDTEKSNWNNKVDKVVGKGLSTNDYDNTAKTKVDAIPINPKYTDTVTEVVDNLTTEDATKALSAKQGKVLQDNKADKSNISRCKTKGASSITTWIGASTERDLEDWIGDLDYRTRELKSNKGLTGASSEFKQQSVECNNARDCKLKAVKWGRIVQLGFYHVYNSNSSTTSSWEYTIPKEFIPSGAHFGVILHGDVEIIPKNDGSDARMIVRKEYGLNSGEIAGTIIYLARYQ